MKDSNTFLVETLRSLTSIPSPSGRTEQIVVWTVELLQSWSIEPELTRRGAIKLKLQVKDSSRAGALTAHLDTLGAMVRHLKDNGRCALAPVGTWSSASQRVPEWPSTQMNMNIKRRSYHSWLQAMHIMKKSLSNLSTGNK